MRVELLALLLLVLGGCGGEERACDEYVVEVETCYDDFCDGDGSDTPFCGCWNDGQDIDLNSCECIALGDLTAVCDIIDVQEVEFDCSTAETAVADFCD